MRHYYIENVSMSLHAILRFYLTSIEILCPLPPSPTNGSIVGSNVQPVDGVITYVCDEGFLLVGSMTRTCLPDRSWTDDAPTCEGIARTCF